MANTCHLCPDSADLTQHLQPAAMGVAALVGLYVFWIYMGHDSKKLAGFKDIDVHIQSGLCDTAAKAAESLQQPLVAHLECEPDRVHIETASADLRRGCRIVVQHSGGEHAGAHGRVVKTQKDGSYKVKLEDVSKAQQFTRQQLRERTHVVENAAQTPANVFVLTDEWAASPRCVQTIVLSLAARAGMDLSSSADVDIHKELLVMPHDKLSALRKGAFLVVVSSDSSGVLDSEAYKKLTDQDAGLGFPPAVIFNDPGTTAATLHAPISAFLDEERLDAAYKQLTEEFASAAKDTAQTIRDLVANRERFVRAARMAGRTSAMLRINLPHIQIISWSWSLNLSWPASVLALRDTIGAFFSLDLMTAARPECVPADGGPGADGAVGGPGVASLLAAAALMMFVIFLLVLLWIKSICCNCLCCRSKDKQLEEARKAHIVHYRYGLYSLAFPLLITQAVKWLDWSEQESYVYRCLEEEVCWTNNEVPHIVDVPTGGMQFCVGIAGFWVLLLVAVVPLTTLRTLRRKYKAGLLSDENPSLATQARLGWLYDKYTEDCYYFEFVALVGRAVLILSGILLTKNHPIFGQLVCIVVILVSMALLIKLKPFEEEPEDAAKWSSINKLAAEAAACQAIDMGLGLVSKVLEDNGMTTELSGGLITISAVLVFLVPLTMTAMAEVQMLAGLKKEKDELDDARDDLVEVTASPL